MGGTPHFLDDSNGLKEKAASLALVDTGLAAGHAHVLAIMDDNALDNITVIIFDGDVVDRRSIRSRQNLLNRIPCVCLRVDSSADPAFSKMHLILCSLIYGSAFDDGRWWNWNSENRSRIALSLPQKSQAVRKFFTDCRRAPAVFFKKTAVCRHIAI